MAKYKTHEDFQKDMKETYSELWKISQEYNRIMSQMIIKRAEKGWSQAELAKKCGLKQSAIARLESGKTTPRLDTLIKVFNALGLSLQVSSQNENVIKNLIFIHDWKKNKESTYEWDRDFGHTKSETEAMIETSYDNVI